MATSDFGSQLAQALGSAHAPRFNQLLRQHQRAVADYDAHGGGSKGARFERVSQTWEAMTDFDEEASLRSLAADEEREREAAREPFRPR